MRLTTSLRLPHRLDDRVGVLEMVALLALLLEAVGWLVGTILVFVSREPQLRVPGAPLLMRTGWAEKRHRWTEGENVADCWRMRPLPYTLRARHQPCPLLLSRTETIPPDRRLGG